MYAHADLVPRENAEAWLKYFRQELPTVAFKAATKKSGTIAHSSMPHSLSVPATAECLGADSLLQLLKNYVHSTGAKVAITVGLIGAPNVGKSSIINSLKRSKVAAVGNTPGMTTGVQLVHLDKHLRLVDSPGIVFSDVPNAVEGALRNCLKVPARVPALHFFFICLCHVFQCPSSVHDYALEACSTRDCQANSKYWLAGDL
jgi:nuclear GTP-binding protein